MINTFLYILKKHSFIKKTNYEDNFPIKSFVFSGNFFFCLCQHKYSKFCNYDINVIAGQFLR